MIALAGLLAGTLASAAPAAASVQQCAVGHYCFTASMQPLQGAAGINARAHIYFHWHDVNRTQLTFDGVWASNVYGTDRSCSFQTTISDRSGHRFPTGPYNCNSNGTAVAHFAFAPLIPSTTVAEVWFYNDYYARGDYAYHSLAAQDFNVIDCGTTPCQF